MNYSQISDALAALSKTTRTLEDAYCDNGGSWNEVITGINFIKDFAAGLRDFFGGRSGSYEKELMDARQHALAELQDRAASLGADGVVGIDFDYEVLGGNNSMLMVTASGTAVRFA